MHFSIRIFGERENITQIDLGGGFWGVEKEGSSEYFWIMEKEGLNLLSVLKNTKIVIIHE